MEHSMGTDAKNILIVEDDPRVAGSLKKGLAEEGFNPTLVRTAQDAVRALDAGSFDIVLLDIGLPDGNGLDILRKVRAAGSAMPVLVLTARDAVKNRVEGLDLGADDYLVKPFAFPELLARIRALTRRVQAASSRTLGLGDLSIDLIARRVERGGKAIELTAREFDLLVYLVQAAGQIVSREMLARDVWKVQARATPMDNVIDVHISHLRDKIDRGYPNRLLHTVRGVGFVLKEQA